MADDSGMYVANRNVTVTSEYGYCIRFKKGEPVYVPPLAREEVLAFGILPVDGEIPIVEEKEKPPEPIGPARVRAIKEAVQKIRERNDVGDFTAGGVPKEAAVIKEAGFKVARKEINTVYSELVAEAG